MKKLREGFSKTGGRSNTGRITAFHRGGGHKRKHVLINYSRAMEDVAGKVVKIEYSAGRSAYVSLVVFSNGVVGYMLSTEGVKVGDCIMRSSDGEVYKGVRRNGCILKLKDFDWGEEGHSLELKPGDGGKVCRAAGSAAIIVKKDEEGRGVVVKMRSGEYRLFDEEALGVIGTVSNMEHRYMKKYKAGRNRWLGRRPVVRGVAMNPVDHPHGGGEGKTSGGRPSVSPWGKLTKGVKTRKNNRNDKLILMKRK